MSGALTIDASEIASFGTAMSTAPAALQGEMKVASSAAMVEGIGLAQANAPVAEGFLRASIGVIVPASATGGSFGTSVVYAWIREVGGTIRAKPGKFLVFPGRNGKLVFVKQVTQTGTHYMERAANTLEPRLERIYGMAVERALASISSAAD